MSIFDGPYAKRKERPSTTHGRCVTCGKPRAGVIYNSKLKTFIHAACKEECEREAAERRAKHGT